MDLMSTHEHVWDRFMTGWHVAFGLFVGLAAIWVGSTTHLTATERVWCFALLGLISFLTAGEDEVRAWTIVDGESAVEAAGAIHSDLAQGFVRAQVIAYDQFLEA